MENPFSVGDKVYRNYPFDGTPKAGYPDKRRIFTITKIEDSVPIDGIREKNAICWLSPGAFWSFYWNLSKAE